MKAVAIWKDHTHIMPDLCPWMAEAHVSSILADGVEGQIPVAAFVVPEDVRFVLQDTLGSWWFFTKKPVKDAQGTWCFLSEDAEQHHKTRTGWWTYKLFNLEK